MTETTAASVNGQAAFRADSRLQVRIESSDSSPKDDCKDLVVRHDGDVIQRRCDDMENPRFERDLDWVAEAIEEAYEWGMEDGMAARPATPARPAAPTRTDSRDAYGAIRCLCCGRPWEEHDATCPRHDFRPGHGQPAEPAKEVA